MRCNVCGLEYALDHNCPGNLLPPDPEHVSPEGFAPLFYLHVGWAIARWDDLAIRYASRDRFALSYGAFFMFLSAALVFLLQVFTNPSLAAQASPFVLLFGTLFMAMYFATIYVILFGACHLAARWFFGGTGTFSQVLRPLALSSFLLALAAIPWVGPFVTGIWWNLIVTSFVFEEIHGLRRSRTILLVIFFNAILTSFLFGFFGSHFAR